MMRIRTIKPTAQSTMTFPLHPNSINSSGSIMYALEKAGKTTDELVAFCKEAGYAWEVQRGSFWFYGVAINEFLGA